MPPASVWVPNIKETGELGLLTDQVRSVPNSLHSVAWFPPQDPYPQDIAHLTWAASGNLISAVSLASDAYFTETYGGYPNGYVDYMCVTMGGTKACLSYRYPGTSTFSITFPTLAPPKPFCEVNSISYQQWMRIEMTLSTAGVLTLSTDGVTTTCSSSVPISSGASSVQIGAESISPGNWGDLRLDNLVAHVRR
jgi:hypothetical protein